MEVHASHFSGIWGAAVKSFKTHLRKVMGDVKLTFEELNTVLLQIEACLNSRPLTPLPDSDDSIKALTPGQFLIGKPMEALPDPSASYEHMPLLRHWHLCQSLVCHFWARWSAEYMCQLRKYSEWRYPSQVNDLVYIREDTLIPTKWPLARVVEVHQGKDGFVRVATVRTSKGVYTRPIVKLVPILPNSD